MAGLRHTGREHAPVQQPGTFRGNCERARKKREGILNKRYGNPAALVFACPECNAASGIICSGAARPKTYRYTTHKPRQQLLEMPRDRADWDQRMDLVRAAPGRAGSPSPTAPVKEENK